MCILLKSSIAQCIGGSSWGPPNGLNIEALKHCMIKPIHRYTHHVPLGLWCFKNLTQLMPLFLFFLFFFLSVFMSFCFGIFRNTEMQSVILIYYTVN